MLLPLIAASLVLQSSSSVLIVDGLPIASISGRTWTSFSDSKPSLPSKSAYNVGLTTLGKTMKVKELVYQDGPGYWFVDFGTEGDLGVYLCGRKPSRPRGIEKLSAKSAVYEKELSSFLATSKPAGLKPHIRQILRADLDGDGVKEVLIESSSQTSPIVQPSGSDYSLVLLRHVVKGKVKTETLMFDPILDPESGLMYLTRIRSIADLDGDGVMEVVLSSDYYEGQSASVWRLKAGKVVKVTENGAGV